MLKSSLLKKTRKYWIPALIIVLIFIFFSRKSAISVMVRKVEVRDREVKRSVSASGIVKSRNQATLSFLASGVIREVKVSDGDFVKKGQLLAYLNSRTQYETVQAYKDSRDIVLRQKELFENEKSTNQSTLGGEDSYNIKLREYNESLSQAEASYQAQLSVLSNYYIYAPFEGVITNVEKKTGETAIAGSTVIEIADLDGQGLLFDVYLDQEDFGLIKEGQEVDIELDAYPNTTFNGTVEKLPMSAEPTTGAFEIRIGMNKSDLNINIGMTGDAYMITDKSDKEVQSLTFNEISYDDDDKPFVWVLENGKVKRLYVELGLEGDLYTEIKTDLSGKVIVVPAKEDLVIKEGFFAKAIN